jgi:hypothetical protein
MIASVRLLRRSAAAAALLFAVVAPRAARAQDDNMVTLKSGTGIEREAVTYRLTVPVLPRFAAALHETVLLRNTNPAVFKEQTATYTPPAVAAIYSKAKISPDEFQDFFSALMGATLIGEESPDTAEFPVLAANIRFIKAHPKEMTPINADLAALMQDFGAGK